ncbi:hypothetical protein NPIL_139841 [Nephila pilipes]|uniref:Uncharacterized protein n=1 Tax=Nephila pilipes TaxID=299642 RepID=A0A8X6TJT4_NEPPI|nr:hypothetical protein NPIL_139841 [Nephila pilipes]
MISNKDELLNRESIHRSTHESICVSSNTSSSESDCSVSHCSLSTYCVRGGFCSVLLVQIITYGSHLFHVEVIKSRRQDYLHYSDLVRIALSAFLTRE